MSAKAQRVDPELLILLACPNCRGELSVDPGRAGLVCTACRLTFPVRDGTALLLPADVDRTGFGGH